MDICEGLVFLKIEGKCELGCGKGRRIHQNDDNMVPYSPQRHIRLVVFALSGHTTTTASTTDIYTNGTGRANVSLARGGCVEFLAELGLGSRHQGQL
jgi:hypothetical protein